jgi:hypothetical protein
MIHIIYKYNMSGQPIKTKSDQVKFLDEYMENLALQIELQTENEKSNEIYRRTGQLPQLSSLPDNRTVEDKLKDVEFLKKSIISDVSKVIEKNLAMSLVDEIIKSKYNTDNSLLRFFAQRGPEFIKEIEKRYKFGLKDYNDIVSTVKFIEKAYNETLDSTTSIKDIMGRNQNIAGEYSSDELLQLKSNMERLSKTILIKNPDLIKMDIDPNDLNLLNQKLSSIHLALPTNTDFDRYFKTLSYLSARLSTDPDMDDRTDILDLINTIRVLKQWITDNLPTSDFIKNINNRLNKIITSKYSDIEKQRLVGIYIRDLINSFQNVDLDSITRIRKYKVEFDKDIKLIINHYNLNFSNANVDIPSEIVRTITNPQININTPTPPQGVVANPIKENVMRRSYEFYYNTHYNNLNNIGLLGTIPDLNALNQLDEIGLKDALKDLFDILINNNLEPDTLWDADPQLTKIIKGGRIRGKGLPKFEDRIDVNSGIKPSQEFVPFGSYLINRRKINDGIISIKTGKGFNITGYPNKRVSSRLSKIIKSIIGGGVPSHDELSSLDQEEKEYLHKISKKSNILDKLSIPTPSKDEIDKDIHNFEVYKGEIMAGNDNRDLIKKFKLLLLKLKNKGLIPKAQAEEILTDISTLGY